MNPHLKCVKQWRIFQADFSIGLKENWIPFVIGLMLVLVSLAAAFVDPTSGFAKRLATPGVVVTFLAVLLALVLYVMADIGSKRAYEVLVDVEGIIVASSDLSQDDLNEIGKENRKRREEQQQERRELRAQMQMVQYETHLTTERVLGLSDVVGQLFESQLGRESARSFPDLEIRDIRHGLSTRYRVSQRQKDTEAGLDLTIGERLASSLSESGVRLSQLLRQEGAYSQGAIDPDALRYLYDYLSPTGGEADHISPVLFGLRISDEEERWEWLLFRTIGRSCYLIGIAGEIREVTF